MRLTPLDIKKQDFKRVMRGVDPEEVQAFLQMLGDQWQDLLDEHNRLEHKITELETKLEHYKQIEEALQEAVKTARESSRQTLDVAKNKAKSIVDAAADTAERIHQRAQEDQYTLRRDVTALRARRSETLARLRNVLRSELEILDEFDQQYPVREEADAGPAPEIQAESIESPDSDAEREAVEDMVELEATVTGDQNLEPEGEERAEPDVLQFGAEEHQAAEELADELTADKGLLSRPFEPAEDTPEPSEQTPAPTPESQRDSTEMDKIRKILDDLV